jgi:hypothetical protein
MIVLYVGWVLSTIMNDTSSSSSAFIKGREIYLDFATEAHNLLAGRTSLYDPQSGPFRISGQFDDENSRLPGYKLRLTAQSLLSLFI